VQAYGTAAAQAALLASHEQTFASWLSFNLEQQKADLDLYLSTVITDREAIVDIWLRLEPFRNLVPATARESEKRLFASDFTALLELLRREFRLQKPEREK
jgi:hypothetical protein